MYATDSNMKIAEHSVSFNVLKIQNGIILVLLFCLPGAH